MYITRIFTSHDVTYLPSVCSILFALFDHKTYYAYSFWVLDGK